MARIRIRTKEMIMRMMMNVKSTKVSTIQRTRDKIQLNRHILRKMSDPLRMKTTTKIGSEIDVC